jgi:hypothetical protein
VTGWGLGSTKVSRGVAGFIDRAWLASDLVEFVAVGFNRIRGRERASTPVVIRCASESGIDGRACSGTDVTRATIKKRGCERDCGGR